MFNSAFSNQWKCTAAKGSENRVTGGKNSKGKAEAFSGQAVLLFCIDNVVCTGGRPPHACANGSRLRPVRAQTVSICALLGADSLCLCRQPEGPLPVQSANISVAHHKAPVYSLIDGDEDESGLPTPLAVEDFLEPADEDLEVTVNGFAS